MAKLCIYQSIVKQIMERKPDARDSDYILFYYFLQTLKINLDELTAHQLLRQMNDEIIPCIMSISRVRRLIENKYPEFRGRSYEKRHREKVEEIEKELGYNRTPFGAPGTTP